MHNGNLNNTRFDDLGKLLGSKDLSFMYLES